MKEVKTIHPKDNKEWRDWLKKNHTLKEPIWVVCSKKNAAAPTMSHDEAVNEALCYGWIDSTARSLDEDTYLQSFTQRKPKSVWSKISKAKVAQLIAEGKMAQPGYDSIEVAKGNGFWSILDEVEELIIPPDLESEFTKKPEAKDYFLTLSRSDRKRVLQWIVVAQRQETRQNRITEVVASAAQNMKPKPLAS